MPGTNAGTGQPLTPRCHRCKNNPSLAAGGYLLALTGRRKRRRARGSIRMDPNWAYEYVCHDCKKLGWSNHMTLARRWALGYGDG